MRRGRRAVQLAVTWRADIIVCAQLWSMLVGLPLCALGGVLYSWQ